MVLRLQSLQYLSPRWNANSIRILKTIIGYYDMCHKYNIQHSKVTKIICILSQVNYMESRIYLFSMN